MRGSEFAELQAFLAVAEQGSFVRAAEALQVSPSALSQTIKGLESRLEVRLFNRTTRRVALTQAGERLLQRLGPAMSEVEAAVTDAVELGERPRGRLRIHAFRVGYQLYLEPLLAAFAEAYPDIELDLTLDDQPVDMVEASFDAYAANQTNHEGGPAMTDHPYVGMWATADGHVRHELLPNGRYDEARGNRESAYQGRYEVTGHHIEYWDDTGFTADGDFIDGVLHHGGMVLYRQGAD